MYINISTTIFNNKYFSQFKSSTKLSWIRQSHKRSSNLLGMPGTSLCHILHRHTFNCVCLCEWECECGFSKTFHRVAESKKLFGIGCLWCNRCRCHCRCLCHTAQWSLWHGLLWSTQKFNSITSNGSSCHTWLAQVGAGAGAGQGLGELNWPA